jgi:transglutaminase-like putative cysteine protease
MQIRIGFEIVTHQAAPTPMVLLLHTRPELRDRLLRPDDLQVMPANVPTREFIDGFGNRCVRLVAPAGPITFSCDALIEDDGELDPVVPDAVQHPIEELPDECLQFLLASRYCEVDRLSGFAWERFGGTAPGWVRVQAVTDFVHKHVTFGYEYASPTKTAGDVLSDGKGVCRDYQHLAVALCRALGVPARYATGHIGDIRIPNPSDAPGDFSAWFQAYLGGQWWDFDARYNTPRIGRTLMAVGRDAADVALITSFGPHTLDKFEVWCEEVTD